MPKYHIIESYIYEVYADSEEQAFELFEDHDKEGSEVEFLDNQNDIEEVTP